MGIKDLNVRPGTINLLEENIGSKLLDTGLFCIWPQMQRQQKQIIKWDYVKLKSFSTEKETNNKMKMQPI